MFRKAKEFEQVVFERPAQVAQTSGPSYEQRIAALESSVSALYSHFNIQRVRVTETILDGLKTLATETREEMRKIAKARE